MGEVTPRPQSTPWGGGGVFWLCYRVQEKAQAPGILAAVCGHSRAPSLGKGLRGPVVRHMLSSYGSVLFNVNNKRAFETHVLELSAPTEEYRAF